MKHHEQAEEKALVGMALGCSPNCDGGVRLFHTALVSALAGVTVVDCAA